MVVLTSIICVCSLLLSLRGTVDAQAAYILLESGCEIAGGLKDPPSGKLPHDLAMGGKFQKDEGCTIDSHCDQFNPALGQSLCNTDTGSCERGVVPCTGVQKEVVVEILTDNYPGETTWTLIDLCGYGENISGGPYTRRSRTYSSSNDVCEGRYKFQINVSYSFCASVHNLPNTKSLIPMLTSWLCVCAFQSRTLPATAFAAVMVQEVTASSMMV